MTDKIVFELKNPIKVQINIDGKNNFIDLDKIYLSAPKPNHKDKTLPLKKQFLEAVFLMPTYISRQKAEEEAQKTGTQNPTAKEIKGLLYAFKDFDIVKFYQLFTNFLPSVAFKDEDNTQRLIHLDIDKISENDFEELLAKYLEVFFIQSWFATLS